MSKIGGKPPKDYQFKKGESGNPKGRPRGTSKPRTSVFDVVTKAEFTIWEGGTARTLSAHEALDLNTVKRALDGDKKTWAEVLDMITTRQKYLDANAPRPPDGKILIGHHDPSNAFEAMTLLEIASYHTERGRLHNNPAQDVPDLLLERWAVQKALNRRSLTKLWEDDKALVHAWTWPKESEDEEIIWPSRFDDAG